MTISRGLANVVSAVRRATDHYFECDANIAAPDVGPILAAAAAASGWRDSRVFNEVQEFSASKAMQLKHKLGSRNYELSARWKTRREKTTIRWIVENTASQFHRVPDDEAMRKFGEALATSLTQHADVTINRRPPPTDPVVPPGGQWNGGMYYGDLRDYSRIAPPQHLNDLRSGIFSLGTYAFPGLPAPALFIPETPDQKSRELLRHRGILLCAPTRSGKTALILRWAESAIANGFSTIIVDPKGNLFDKLERRLGRKGISADLYHFSTDPRDSTSATINFLEGLELRLGDNVARDRLRQIAAALLPRSAKAVGEENYRRVLHRDWAFALLIILKLAEHHCPDKFNSTDNETGEVTQRPADLADLYDLAASEDALVQYIHDIREGEAKLLQLGLPLEVESVDRHLKTLAIALDPAKFPAEGKRKGDEFYEALMSPLRLALEPFGDGGLLHDRICSDPARRNFGFDMMGQRTHPKTLVLAARMHDEEPAETVLQLAVARMQHMVLDRMPSGGDKTSAKPPGKLMLFLDETQRIAAFDPKKYFEVAAEAGVTAVVVYQSLEGIGADAIRDATMKNVGIQVYLGNIRGADEPILNRFMGARNRLRPSFTIGISNAGANTNTSLQNESSQFFLPAILYKFPSDNYPALVIMNDEAHQPFFTDLYDPELETG